MNTKGGGRVGEDGSLPVNGVVFLFLRMLLGESSGLKYGVLNLGGRGVEDLQTSLLSIFLLQGEQLLVKSGRLSVGCWDTIGGNSITISSSTIYVNLGILSNKMLKRSC